MAKAINGCNKKAEEGKSVKEKEPVLFEELVRTIYGRLHYKDDEPIGDDDDNAPGNKQTSVPDERSFSCNEFSRVFLTADGKTASHDGDHPSSLRPLQGTDRPEHADGASSGK